MHDESAALRQRRAKQKIVSSFHTLRADGQKKGLLMEGRTRASWREVTQLRAEKEGASTRAGEGGRSGSWNPCRRRREIRELALTREKERAGDWAEKTTRSYAWIMDRVQEEIFSWHVRETSRQRSRSYVHMQNGDNRREKNGLRSYTRELERRRQWEADVAKI